MYIIIGERELCCLFKHMAVFLYYISLDVSFVVCTHVIKIETRFYHLLLLLFMFFFYVLLLFIYNLSISQIHDGERKSGDQDEMFWLSD
jgi:Ca2+/Na+ antiporter